MQKTILLIFSALAITLLSNPSHSRDIIVIAHSQTFNDTVPVPDVQLSDPEIDTIPETPTATRGERITRPAIASPAETGEQEKPKSAVTWYTEEGLQTPLRLSPNYIDTTLLDLHHYDFAKKSGWFYASKGNPGHAHRRLVFEPDFSNGINTGAYLLYGDYLFRHQDLKYYRPRHVFTDLFYLMGDEREQLFHATHAQKLHETFYIGFNYRVINSPGLYSRMGTRNTNVSLTADYLSPDKRYQALGSFVYNRLRTMESGGLKDRLQFEAEPENDSVFLYRAEARYRDMSFNLRHFYQTGFYTGTDTLETERFINLGRINHDFSYKRKAFIFDETNPPYTFYDFNPVYNEETFDSTTVHRIENMISWSNFPLQSGRGSFPFNFKVYLKHSINTVQQPYWPEGEMLLDTLDNPIYQYQRLSYNQLIQGVELQSDQTRFLSFGGYANLTVGGYNDEDFHLGGYLNLGQESLDYNFRAMLRAASMEAPYFFNNFSGNYIQWENDFNKIQMANLQAQINTPFGSVVGNYYLLDKAVYFNTNALPVQNPSAFSYISLAAHSDIELGWLGLRNHIVFQQSTTGQFEDFPDWVSYHSVYANFRLSDGNLVNQAGFDVSFNSGYRAMSYMPVSRAFYTQNQYQTGENIFVDVFWSAKVSRARLFVKYQNLLGLLPDSTPLYQIPFYPIPESMFKFGVSWMFFD